MANFTSKLNLEKPLGTENYDVGVFNSNADKIDDFAAAIDLSKVEKVEGKGLSTEDYTTEEKNKVANLPLDTNTQLLDIANDVDYLKSRNAKVYGVRRVLGATSPALERLADSVGKVVGVPIDDSVVTDELNVYPFNAIKECIIDSNGWIWYKGEVGYNSVIGDHMVEFPVFWYRIIQTATVRDEYISDMPLPEFKVPQLFMREDGTVIPKVYVAKYKTSKVGGVGLDVSRPLEHSENFRNLASFRTEATNKGSGWQQIDIWYTFVLHLLYRIKYANLNSQNILSNGITSVRYNAGDTAQLAETSVNRIVVLTTVAGNFDVGQTIAIGTSLGSTNVANRRQITAINAINGTQSELVFDGSPVNVSVGNVVWCGAQRTGQTAGLNSLTSRKSGINGRRSFKLFGVEDAFGNVYEWVDGLLINNLVGHVCRNRSQYASALNSNYKPLGYINAGTDGYLLEMGYDSNNEDAQLPVQIGAGSTTGYADYYYQNIGLRGACFGGNSLAGAFAGLFLWLLVNSPSSAFWNVGGRLLFKPPVH